MKRRRYKSLEVDRVDLVDRGANFDRETGDGSHILLVKRDQGQPTEKVDLKCPECSYRLPLGYGDGGTTMPNYCPECGAKLTLRASASKQEPTMPAAANAETLTLADVQKMLDAQKAETDAAIAKAVAAAKAEAETKAEAEKQALQKRAEDAEKKAGEAAELAKAEVERREIADCAAVAKSLEGAGLTPEDGPLLFRLSKALTAEDNTRVRTLLSAAAEQIRVGKLFAAQGRQGEPPAADAAGNPEQVLMAKAAELRKSDPKLSEADAIDRACELYPAERNAYQAWKRTQITGRPQ